MNDEFIDQLAALQDKPLDFSYWAYPWGQAGTELADYFGPDKWQVELFQYIQDQLEAGELIVRVAVKSGHGIGKSAGSSMLTDWGMSTMVGTRGIITANTERQLRTKTWVELAKWRRLSITKELFKLKATSMYSTDVSLASEWRFDQAPWSERNTEAFAGLHNKGKRLLLIMDEASAIADIVFEVAEGALTDKDTQIIIVLFGNPTKNTGRFRECFEGGKHEHRWKQFTVDSRDSAITNKELINQWITDYGIDSDFVRVRALGLFPRHDVQSLISRATVEAAVARPTPTANYAPVVLGVDVARQGDDFAVIYPRQGFDARSRPVERYSKLDLVQLAAKAAEAATKYNATTIFVDTTGVGAGVADILRNNQFNAIDVNFSDAADGVSQDGLRKKLANKRMEIWESLNEYLKHAAIDNLEFGEHTLMDELLSANYFYNTWDAKQLESKRDIKQREKFSPDAAEALAVTLAYPALISVPVMPEELNQFDINQYNPYRRLSL